MMDQCLVVHIPDKQPHDLHHQPTESVFASAIDPKHANQIVRRLNQIAPLEDLRHVKRIQKKVLEGGQIELLVILCLAHEGNNQLDNMPPLLQELISSHQLSPFITKVCKYAATSKEEWQEQCKFWPTSYHPRTYNIDGITGFSEEDSQSVLKFMQSAVEMATSDGMVVNAAVIVDPSAKQIISSACDQIFSWNTCKDNNCYRKPELSSSHPISSSRCNPHEPLHSNSSSNQLKQSYTDVACLYPRQWTEQQSHSQSSYYWHPLRHAAIVAIESSAARDRYLFSSEGNSEDRYLELDSDNSSWTSSPRAPGPPSSPSASTTLLTTSPPSTGSSPSPTSHASKLNTRHVTTLSTFSLSLSCSTSLLITPSFSLTLLPSATSFYSSSFLSSFSFIRPAPQLSCRQHTQHAHRSWKRGAWLRWLDDGYGRVSFSRFNFKFSNSHSDSYKNPYYFF